MPEITPETTGAGLTQYTLTADRHAWPLHDPLTHMYETTAPEDATQPRRNRIVQITFIDNGMETYFDVTDVSIGSTLYTICTENGMTHYFPLTNIKHIQENPQ